MAYVTHKAALLLGSNLGHKENNITNAIQALGQNAGNILTISSLYNTAAWGLQEQPDFINRVILIETELTPEELINEILKTEEDLGRKRNRKWEPRVIDIDILFYDNEIMKTEKLTIPHPHLHERMFALVPLQEILPDWTHPASNKSINELISQCEDKLPVRKIK